MKDRIEDVLKAVREEDRGLAAPDYLETRLRAAFRDQHAPRSRRVFTWWWAAGTACAAVACALVVWSVVWGVASAPEVVPPARPVIAHALPNVPQPRAAVMSQTRRHIERPRPTRETVEFTALPYAPPLMPYDGGQVIRVRLPRQSLRDLGVLLRADRPMDRIPAEILMGDDGVARGIRFVSYR